MTDPHKTMQALLDEIEQLLPRVQWVREYKREEADPGHAARFFNGTVPGDDWNFAVADFDISSQEFPEGSRNWDGAARSVKRAAVIRLTRELAQKAVELAVRATTKASG